MKASIKICILGWIRVGTGLNLKLTRGNFCRYTIPSIAFLYVLPGRVGKEADFRAIFDVDAVEVSDASIGYVSSTITVFVYSEER